MIRTNAIIFQRANAAPGALWETFTSATAGDVDTQATALQSDGKFSAGTFSGVQTSVAIKLTDCLVNNVLNDSSTKASTPGTPLLLWGAVNDSVASTIKLTVTEMTLANGANANLDVANHSFFNIVGPSATATISGFVAPTDGGAQSITIWNTTSQTIQLLNNNSGSTLGNRILTGSGGTREVVGQGSFTAVYDAAQNGWVVTSIDVAGAAGTGTVTSASIVSANGLAGSVATATTTPAITLSTTVTGILKGNGTALSAATVGTDYSGGTAALATGIVKSTTTTGALTIAGAGDFPTLNQNTTGTAASITTPATTEQASPTNPTGTNNSTGLMMGLAVAFTPVKTDAKFKVIVSGNCTNDDTTTVASAVGGKMQIRYGTGAAPANAAALTGTAVGGLISCARMAITTTGGEVTGVTTGLHAFSLNAIVELSGAPVAQWVDISLAQIGGAGIASVSNLSVSIVEL
jgi:hypothetical protein